MHILRIMLFIVANIFLSGCGSTYNKMQAQQQDHMAPLLIAMHTAEETSETETLETLETVEVVETVAEIASVPEVVPPAPPKIIKKPTLVAAPIAEQAPIESATAVKTAIAAPVVITPATAPIAEVVTTNNWQPNEVHLIRGTELINGLQRNAGKKPSMAEMQQRLETHMGLSSTQAQQVINTLGLK